MLYNMLVVMLANNHEKLGIGLAALPGKEGMRMSQSVSNGLTVQIKL